MDEINKVRLGNIPKSGDKFEEEISKSYQLIESKCTDLNLRVNKFDDEIDELSVLADKLIDRYTQAALFYIDMDTILKEKVLQGIIDHVLHDEDSMLLCCFIKNFFIKILKRLHKKDSSYKAVKSLKEIHQQRKTDKELSKLYDEIAVEMDFDNSGKENGCIKQLHAFIKDFYLTIHRERFERKNSPTKDLKVLFSYSIEEQVNKKLKEINLSDKKLVQYITHKITYAVKSSDLRKALLTCVVVSSGTNVQMEDKKYTNLSSWKI